MHIQDPVSDTNFNLYGLENYASVKVVFLGEGTASAGSPLVKFEISTSSDEKRAVFSQIFCGLTAAELNGQPVSISASSITETSEQNTFNVIAHVLPR